MCRLEEDFFQIIFYVFISIYYSLYVSSTSCSSSGETNSINTASGNSHSMLVAEMCAGWKKTFSKLFSMYLFLFITLYMFRAHRAHHQERQIVSIQPLVTVTLCCCGRSLLPTCTHLGHQRRMTITRGCIDIICLS